MKSKTSILKWLQLLLVLGFVGIWVAELVEHSCGDERLTAAEEEAECSEELVEESETLDHAIDFDFISMAVHITAFFIPRYSETVGCIRTDRSAGFRLGWMMPLRN